MPLVRRSSFKEPGLVIPVRRPEKREPERTYFRLIISDVCTNEVKCLEAGLRSISRVEWYDFNYIPEFNQLVVAHGKLPVPPDRAADHYLGVFTHCAWDIVSGDYSQSPPGWYPDVILVLHPEEPDEKTYELNARHYGQYKRRRREFEANGGNVLLTWGLTSIPPPPPEETEE